MKISADRGAPDIDELWTGVQPSYPREAPIGGIPLFKEITGSVFPFANISSKSDLNAIVIGYCLRQYSIVDEK
jgi:hypothetical protein